ARLLRVGAQLRHEVVPDLPLEVVGSRYVDILFARLGSDPFELLGRDQAETGLCRGELEPDPPPRRPPRALGEEVPHLLAPVPPGERGQEGVVAEDVVLQYGLDPPESGIKLRGRPGYILYSAISLSVLPLAKWYARIETVPAKTQAAGKRYHGAESEPG